MATKERVSFLEALRSAGQDELDEVNNRLGELTKELESLKRAKQIIELKVNGKPPKQPRKPNAAGGGKAADKIYECITQNGPGSVEDISLKTGISVQGVRMAITKSNWFEKLGNGKISIARAG